MMKSNSTGIECQSQSKGEAHCKGCGSPRVVRYGTSKGRQKWLCRDCGRVGVANGALPGMRIPASSRSERRWVAGTASGPPCLRSTGGCTARPEGGHVVEKKATKPKQPYEPPIVAKEKQMTFPLRLLTGSGKEIVCKQCSACHGCR